MSERVRVKICGITNPDDAQAAIAAGTDALGFNLWPGSKRHIALEELARWAHRLPTFVTRVAVLVNASLDEARRVAEHPAIDIVQFHGDEDEAYFREFASCGRPFIVAKPLRDSAQTSWAASLPTPNLLLDAAVAGAYGGTGQTVDFDAAAEFVRQAPDLNVILAGGLSPANVQAAAAKVRPFAVDVASGVEKAPGRKDAEKMRAFVAAVRN